MIFLYVNPLEGNSFSNYLGIITTYKNTYIQQLHHSTTQLSSSVSNKKKLVLDHLVLQETGHPVTLLICVSTKKHVSTFTPSPKMALVWLASTLVTQPTHVARTGDILPSANLGMTGTPEMGRGGWRESSLENWGYDWWTKKNGWEMENCKCIQCITHT